MLTLTNMPTVPGVPVSTGYGPASIIRPKPTSAWQRLVDALLSALSAMPV